MDTGYINLLEYMLYNLVRLLPNPLISILKDQIHCHHIFIFYLSFFNILNLSLLLTIIHKITENYELLYALQVLCRLIFLMTYEWI